MAPLRLAHYHARVFTSWSAEFLLYLTAFSVLRVSGDTFPWDKRDRDSREVDVVSSEHLMSMHLWLPLSLSPCLQPPCS